MHKLSARTRRHLFQLFIALLLVGLVYVWKYPNQTPQIPRLATPGLYRVEKVVDGDTLEVRINGALDTVRLIGVDTPETHDPRKPVQCFGENATAYTKGLTEGKDVRLQSVPLDSDRDKYNRLLRYVFLPDGTFVNAVLIRDGYAFAYTVFPHSALGPFRALEAEARQNNRGLWASCNIDESSEIKQTLPR
jgi:micrococcal nuclease